MNTAAIPSGTVPVKCGAREYAVSPEGRVFADRAAGWGEVAPYVNGRGYLVVKLKIDDSKRRVSFRVHRLVADAFLQPPQADQNQLRHLDGNRLNNAASNLAWGTHLDNANDRRRHVRDGRRGRCDSRMRHSLTREEVAQARVARANGESVESIAKGLRITPQYASRMLVGRSRTDVPVLSSNTVVDFEGALVRFGEMGKHEQRMVSWDAKATMYVGRYPY